MATFVVTTSNWNDPSFWSSINVSGSNNTLDFSNLPSNFYVTFDPNTGLVTISDGTTTFRIGDGSYGGATDATLGSGFFSNFDNVIGGQGSNDLYGSNSDDTLTGQGDDDYIDARSGNDSVKGEGGRDTIYGGSGDDTLHGGNDNDQIFGEDGNDQLHGDDGNDNLSGGDGNDSIYAGDGDDFVFGGTGNDELHGHDGDDLIQGNQGDDTIFGGGGRDTIQATDASGFDVVDGGSTGDDEDLLDLLGPSAATFTFTDLENGSYSFANGLAGGTFADFERFDGTSADDTFDLSGYNQSVTVTFTGSATGTISDGTDTIEFTSIENFILGDQSDSVDASNDFAGVDIDGGDGDDTITGGSGADTIVAGTGNDEVDGGSGNDSLEGGDGDDTIYFGEGDNTVYGGSGNDLIDDEDGNPGYAGNDFIDAGSGNDQVYSGNGDDTIAGGSGNDILVGQAGDDRIDGGDGDDLLIGEDGDDTFLVSDGHDTISDFNTGNSGALGDGDQGNNDFINLSGYYDSLEELRDDFDDDGVLNQSNSTASGGTVDYSDNSQFAPSQSLTFQGANTSSFAADNTGVACFANGTHIRTPHGDVLIDELCVGDLILTAEHGAQPILWIGTTAVSKDAGTLTDRTCPVRIKPNMFGNERALIVSPQHCVSVRLGSQKPVFVRARHLAEETPLASFARGRTSVVYVHLFLAQHATIWGENIPSESFYPGHEALKGFDTSDVAALSESFQATGENADIVHYGPRARTVLSRTELRRLWSDVTSRSQAPRALGRYEAV